MAVCFVTLVIGLFVFATAIVAQLESKLGLSPWDTLHQGNRDRLSESSLGARIALLAAAMALIGVGSALYLGAGLGAGPRDSLTVVGGERSGLRLGLVRALLELAALGAGYTLGGTVGVGTVVFALGVGPALESGFWLLRRSPLAERTPALATPAPAPLAGS
jgi:uncharacterized membrane protein YczE